MLMEQHFGSVRLFGKKSVAVILGILSIFSFSSAMAEKLDTTFVLDMVIDTTPCYYTTYNRAGQITDLGLYDGIGDFSRINVGYVTDQSGKAVDTLYYVCDRVTKRWSNVTLLGIFNSSFGYPSYEYQYYDNGMLKSIGYRDHDDFSIFGYSLSYSSDGYIESVEDYNECHPNNTKRSKESVSRKGTKYDKYGYITYDYEEEYTTSWTWTVDPDYPDDGYYTTDYSKYEKNYDNSCENGNLISCNISSSNSGSFTEKYSYSYDSLDRRIKMERYVENELLASVVYTYGHPLLEGEPIILSLIYKGDPINGFSSDKFDYDLSDTLLYDDVEPIAPLGTTVEKSYDVNTHTLTLIAKGKDYEKDSSQINTYNVIFITPESYVTSMNFDGNAIDTFSTDKYQYDFSDYYLYAINTQKDKSPILQLCQLNADKSVSYFDVTWELSKFATSHASYDSETGDVTITVTGDNYKQDSSNVHLYKILTKKIDRLPIDTITLSTGSNIAKDTLRVNVEAGLSDCDLYYYSSVIDIASYNDISSDCSFAQLSKKSYSDLTHTWTVVFSHPADASLADTFHIHFHPLIELTSIDDKDGKTHSFATDKFEYESDWKYDPCLVKYDVPDDVTVTRSYDESTGVLTLTARFANDTTQKTEYRIRYAIRQMQSPYINSLFAEEMSVDTFASDKYEYEFEREYEPGLVKYGFSDGIAVTESYDDSTSILTLTVYYDSDTTQKTEYKIHFRPTNGVDDFGGDNVRLYVVDRTICVDGLQSSLSVYDMMGRLVGTGSGESVRVPVQSGGVYVVTSEGNSVKVVVE